MRIQSTWRSEPADGFFSVMFGRHARAATSLNHRNFPAMPMVIDKHLCIQIVEW
jgi:hypothetical protein